MSSNQLSYCVKCRTKTPSQNPSMSMAKNGRPMVKSTCSRCGTSKSSFVSAKNETKFHSSGKGMFGSMLGSMLPF